MSSEPATLTAPPWQMRGQGWIVLCHWPRAWLIEHGWVPANLAERFVGGPGALMLVDYQDCPIGPYRELLMVPGRFRTPVGTRPSITRILVSTQISVDNGRSHWAIPKTLGEFQIDTGQIDAGQIDAGQIDSRQIDANARSERWSISENGQPLARFELHAGGPQIPVNTNWAPRALGTLAQPRDDNWLLTRPQARGRVRWAKLDAHWTDPSGFPDIGAGRQLLALRVVDFQMSFAQARNA